MLRGVANRYAPLGVLLQNGKDGGAVKVAAQLPGGDRLRPVWREVGQRPPALLDGHTSRNSREENSSKLAAVARAFRRVCRSFSLFVSNLVCPGRDTACNHGGVLLVQCGLSLFLRPIFPVCDTVLAAVQEVDLVKSFPVAHLHDLGLEVA